MDELVKEALGRLADRRAAVDREEAQIRRALNVLVLVAELETTPAGEELKQRGHFHRFRLGAARARRIIEAFLGRTQPAVELAEAR